MPDQQWSAETLGAHPIYLPAERDADRLNEELRKDGYDPETVSQKILRDYRRVFLPTVRVWLRHTPPVSSWLAETGADPVTSCEFNDGQREDIDSTILTITNASGSELDIPLPTALCEITARACMLAKDPMIFAFDLANTPLEPQWWARYQAEEPEHRIPVDATWVRRSLIFRATRHLDLLDADDYFDGNPDQP